MRGRGKQCRGSTVVLGFPHAEKTSRREGAERCASSPARGQAKVRSAKEQHLIDHVGSDAVHWVHVDPAYLGYAQLFVPGPLENVKYR